MLFIKGDVSVMTAKVFQNGGNQDVNLPKDSKWHGLLQSLELFSDDYMSEREQGILQERE